MQLPRDSFAGLVVFYFSRGSRSTQEPLPYVLRKTAWLKCLPNTTKDDQCLSKESWHLSLPIVLESDVGNSFNSSKSPLVKD